MPPRSRDQRESRRRRVRGRAGPGREGRRWPLAVIILAALVPALPAHADFVVLTNGNEIQGEIVKEESDRITLRFPGGTLVVPRKQIAALKRESRLDYLLAEAEKQLQRGSLDEAVGTFLQAQTEAPDSVRARDGLIAARERLGASLRDLGRFREARSAFEALLQCDPGNRRAPEELQRIEATLKDLAREEEKAHEELARGDLEAGIWRLERLHASFPDRREAVAPVLGEAMARQADASLRRQEWEKAERLYANAIGVFPETAGRVRHGYASIKLLKAEPLAREGDFRALELEAREGLDVDPTNLLLRYYHGVSLEGQGRKRDAAEEYLEVTGARRPANLEKAVTDLRREAEAALARRRETTGTAPPPGAGDDGAAADGEEYRDLTTTHFVVRHRNEARAAELAKAAESAYGQIFRLLGLTTHLRDPIGIHLYPTKEEYLENSGAQPWSGGAHQVLRAMGSLSKHRITCFQEQPRLLAGVLPHEIAHALLPHRLNYAGVIPLWANEGFAVFCEPAYVHRHYERLVASERARRTLLPVGEVISRETYPGERVPLFYGQCYSLVAFLIAEKDVATFVDFLKEVTRKPQELESQLRRRYRIEGIPALENRWLGWVDYAKAER